MFEEAVLLLYNTVNNFHPCGANERTIEREYTHKSAILLLKAKLVTCNINISVPFASLKSALKISALGCKNGHLALSAFDNLILPPVDLLYLRVYSLALRVSFSTSRKFLSHIAADVLVVSKPPLLKMLIPSSVVFSVTNSPN